MGIRCSLLGHAYSESDTRRERLDRGEEVVTIVQDVERCSRCGAERVVSENKEVVSVVEEDPAGPADGAGPAGGSGSGAGSFAGGDFDPPDDPAEEDAEILEGTSDDDGRAPGQWPDDPDAGPEPWEPEPIGENDASGTGGEAADTGASASGDEDSSSGPAHGAAEPAPDPTADRDESVTRTSAGSLHCPECGHAVDADSPYVAGDACPECQQGYLDGA